MGGGDCIAAVSATMVCCNGTEVYVEVFPSPARGDRLVFLVCYVFLLLTSVYVPAGVLVCVLVLVLRYACFR